MQHAELYEKSCDDSHSQSMQWLDEMNSALEAEGFKGPECPEEDERVKVAQGIRNTWLFNNALRHSGVLYLEHCINPFMDTAKWNLKLGPRLVANLSQGSVRRNAIRFLETAFFLFSLGSLRGETIVDFSGSSSWSTLYEDQPLGFCILHRFADDKSWIGDEPFYQLARQFVDEVLRRTDVQKLRPKSYKEVKRFCRVMRENKFLSAGLDSFMRNASPMYEGEREAFGAENRAIKRRRSPYFGGGKPWAVNTPIPD